MAMLPEEEGSGMRKAVGKRRETAKKRKVDAFVSRWACLEVKIERLLFECRNAISQRDLMQFESGEYAEKARGNEAAQKTANLDMHSESLLTRHSCPSRMIDLTKGTNVRRGSQSHEHWTSRPC
jgi:hypothetical protein